MPNIEIKARYSDSDKARSIAKKLNGYFVGIDRQVDTYFKTRAGRLKLRESSLGGTQLIPYLRPNDSGPKKSDYAVIKIEAAQLCKKLLGEILEIEVVVEKTREIFLLGNVRVHIDNVGELGNFFEFEAVYEVAEDENAEREKVEGLMRAFEISADDLVRESYRELRCAP